MEKVKKNILDAYFCMAESSLKQLVTVGNQHKETLNRIWIHRKL